MSATHDRSRVVCQEKIWRQILAATLWIILGRRIIIETCVIRWGAWQATSPNPAVLSGLSPEFEGRNPLWATTPLSATGANSPRGATANRYHGKSAPGYGSVGDTPDSGSSP